MELFFSTTDRVKRYTGEALHNWKSKEEHYGSSSRLISLFVHSWITDKELYGDSSQLTEKENYGNSSFLSEKERYGVS